jgi:hypothetical protein
VREYDADEIREAFERSLGADPVEDLLSRRLRDPAGPATALALELARGVDPEADPAVGASAVVCGLLVGARLPPQEPGLLRHLFDGLSTVRSFGRHAVIARQCDLGAVAEVETAVADALAPGPDRPASVLVLFEIGLALGLAARPAQA